MPAGDWSRRLRAAVRNGVVWGAGWAVLALVLANAMRLAGAFPRATFLDSVGLAVRFGFWGGVIGALFATALATVYQGRRLAELRWWRVGVAGAIGTGIAVPLLLQLLNLVSEGHVIAWSLVLDDGLWTGVLGGLVAGGTIWLAQRADAGRHAARLDDGDALGRLGSPNAWSATETKHAERARR